MKKYVKFVYIAALTLASIYCVVIQFINPVSHFVLVDFVENNIILTLSSLVIITFLLMKSYSELTRSENPSYNSFKMVLMLLLSLLMVINFMSESSSETINLIRISVAFRMLSLVGLLLTLEHFVIKKSDFRKLLLLIVFTVLMVALVFMFTIYELNQLLSAYYFAAILYLILISFKWQKTEGDWSKRIAYNIIILALLNDLAVLTLGLKSIELTFLGVALGLTIIYGVKIHYSYKRYVEMEETIDSVKKENLRLKSDNKRTLKSVELLKTDLSYKFMRKQNYFENLEMAVEVLDASIIIVNSDFKVDLAHGKILEVSGIEDMTGLDVSKAIFDISSDEGQYFKSVVGKVFDAVDEVRENLYLSLLDQKIRISNILYEMKYQIMHKRNGDKILILHAEIVNDHSHQGLVDEREKEISNMLITITRNSEMFFTDLSSYLEFSKIPENVLDDSLEVNENIFKILRRIHTYKGVFDQYNMQSTIRGLNDIENELFNMLHNMNILSLDQFTKIVMGYDLESLLRVDLSIINERLGQQFLENKKRISVDLTSFNRVMLKMSDILEGDHEILKDMEALKFVNIKEIIESYGQYVERIANEQGKYVNFVVVGDHVKVDRNLHINFFEGLIHILKNCIAHGIEYPDERRNKGKSTHAEIKCEVKAYNDYISIVMSDDGRGIDVKEIKNRLFILGKYSIEELDILPDDVVCNMIIEDGITSSSMPNSLAGKGVGMGSIKEIVHDIGGTINVKSQSGQGVTYEICLPYQDARLKSQINYERICNNLSLQTERILTKNNKKDTLSSTWYLEDAAIGQNQLLEVTAAVTIQGMQDTIVCVTLDEKFIYHLISSYNLQLKYKGANLRVLNEAVAVFIKDITSRMANELKGIRETVEVNSAIILSNQMFEESFNNRNAVCASIDINEGKMTIMVMNKNSTM